MKNKFSLILFTALLSTTFAWAQTSSAYYEVPEGAFFAGMTENGSAADKTFYLPYNYGQKYIFTSTEDGDWTSGSGSITPNKKDYSYSNRTMKDSCHTPLLKVEGKAGYQYGASGENYDANLYFHIGDSVMHYMTPARIYDEAGSISQKAIDNYYTKTRDTVGVFFNTDVMYIDSISIPISFGGSSGFSLDAMFPSNAKVYAKIYQATQTTGKSGNKFDRQSAPLRTIELTQSCFKQHPSINYRGVLTATVGEQPLDITGPFVIELTNMKEAGCKFYIYAAKGRSGSNKWGYYVNGTTMTYPGDYTPAISVRAMFPALYTKESKDVKMPAKGASKNLSNRPNRTVFANYKYTKNENGWSFETSPSGYGISIAFNESSDDWVKWLFSMNANETDDVREGYVTFTFRGKQLTFNLIQAPMIKSISILDSEKEEITKLSLKATETATLTASVLPTDADPKEIKWSSDNTGVATADENGVVTAHAPGTATITATSNDNNTITATCTVTVTPKVEEVNVPTSNLIAPSAGGPVKFTNNQTDYTKIEYNIIGKNFDATDWKVTFNKDCDWLEYNVEPDQENLNHAIITLNATGKNETGTNRPGNITIKAYDNTFNYSISQAPMINQIVGLPGDISLKKGDLTYLSPSVQPENTDQDKTITVGSSDISVATVEEGEQTGNYKITAVAPGTAIITAKSVANSEIKAECTVTVYEVTKKDPTATTLEAKPAGGETTVKFTLSGATFNTANWSVTEDLDWISVSEPAFTSEKDGNSTIVTCTLTAAANATGSKRDGTIKIKAFADEFIYSISQESLPSAFYEVPEGAFFAGMSKKGAITYGAIYLPYKKEGTLKFSSVDGAGDWWSNGKEQKKNQKDYSYSNLSMKAKKTIPQLRQEGKVNYQYGGSGVDYDEDHLFFYVGNSDMQYMTPAKLWCDLTQQAIGQAQSMVNTYHTPEYYVMGVYFDNKDVMYIDGISIPITYGSSIAGAGKTVDNLFPNEDSHVVVNIYKATSIGGKKDNKADRTKALWSGTLTKDDFSENSTTTKYRGALNATFEPISIDGPFVVELSDMGECNFYVYSAEERDNCNYWGYCSKSVGSEAYPLSYTLAVSVHAMFPALYPNNDEDLNIEISADGGTVDRTVFANCKYEEGSDWNLSVPEGIGLSVTKDSQDDNSTVWEFVMEANETTAVREGDVTFTFRGKTLTYHVTQAAPEPTAYTRDVTAGIWGTICLPWASTALEGATFYNVLGTKDATLGIALTPIESPNQLEAGKPYVFYATSNKIEVTYNSDGTPEDAPVYAGNHIIGTFKDNTEVPSGKYIIYDNKLYKAGTGVTIDEYRAYFDVDNMEAYNPATAPARVVFFGGSQSPTDINTLPYEGKAGKGSFKVLKDGQLLIIRDTKTYNAQGQLIQ